MNTCDILSVFLLFAKVPVQNEMVNIFILRLYQTIQCDHTQSLNNPAFSSKNELRGPSRACVNTDSMKYSLHVNCKKCSYMYTLNLVAAELPLVMI